MFKIHTKTNHLMVANEFNLEGKNIICNDVMLPSEFDNASRYNPHNVRMWLIGHFYGAVCAIFASHEQAALDIACDAGMMESFRVSEEESKAYYEALNDAGEHPDGINYTGLGNASELHNLDSCWMAEVEFDASRDILLIVALARASQDGADNLEEFD